MGELAGFQSWGIGDVRYGSVAEWLFQSQKGHRKFHNFRSLAREAPAGHQARHRTAGELSAALKALLAVCAVHAMLPSEERIRFEDEGSVFLLSFLLLLTSFGFGSRGHPEPFRGRWSCLHPALPFVASLPNAVTTRARIAAVPPLTMRKIQMRRSHHLLRRIQTLDKRKPSKEYEQRLHHQQGAAFRLDRDTIWCHHSAFAQVTYIFIGDTGERDLDAGERMLQEHPDSMLALFLHVVSSNLHEEPMMPEDRTINDVPVLHFRTYVAAAMKVRIFRVIAHPAS